MDYTFSSRLPRDIFKSPLTDDIILPIKGYFRIQFTPEIVRQ